MPTATKPSATYQIKAARPVALLNDGQGAETVAEVMIYGDIGEGMFFEETVSARGFVSDLSAIDADRIVVRINSRGGSVPDGISIYNALVRHPARITVEIDGEASSIASMIAMAGDDRNMAPNARIMVHSPWAMTAGNAKDLREIAAELDAWGENMIQAFTRVAPNQTDLILDIHTNGRDNRYSAQQALDLGFVTAITGQPSVAARAFQTQTAAAAAHSQEATTMPDTTTAASTSRQTTDHTKSEDIKAQMDEAKAAAKTQALTEFKAQEKERKDSIRTAFKPFAGYTGVSDLQEECIDNVDISASVARDKLMAKLGEGAEPLAGGQTRAAGIQMGEDEVEKRRGAKSQALLAKAGAKTLDKDGKPVQARIDRSNPFRGQSLIEMARGSLDECGVRTQGMSSSDIAEKALAFHVMGAGGQSTSDFPVVLEDAMHKIMVSTYLGIEAVWSQFAKSGTVSDFKDYRRLVPALLGGLDRKNELGEYKQKNIPDAEGEKISAEEYGNIMTVSRQVLINDDMGYIQDMASSIGMAARRGVDTTAFRLLESNPIMRDGFALFSPQHHNLAKGSVVSAESLLELADLIADQLAPGDIAEPLDLRAKIALARRVIARRISTINGAPFNPDVESKFELPNEAFGLVDSVVSTQRIRSDEYYMFADNNIAPAIEVVFLNGQTEPVLVQHEEFRTGSLSWRAQLDYGVGAIDWRGIAKNPGVAAG